jgi:hypothetical protein
MLSHVITIADRLGPLIFVFKLFLFLVLLIIWILIFKKGTKYDYSSANPINVVKSYTLLFLGFILINVFFHLFD